MRDCKCACFKIETYVREQAAELSKQDDSKSEVCG